MNIKEKYKKIVIPEMKKKFGYKNDLAVPKIVKVSVSAGIGSKKDEKEKIAAIEKSLTLLTGQKSKTNQAKKSIAGFKLRTGMPVGFLVTLRGERMYNFLEKMINIALPRMRDFNGLNKNSIDEAGNLTIGFKEHIVFPEAGGDDLRSSFGIGVTVVTNADTQEKCAELLKLIGFPFAKK